MELTIRGSEDKDSRLTETEPQTISIAEEDIIEDENHFTFLLVKLSSGTPGSSLL